jgi:hypothetical protein
MGEPAAPVADEAGDTVQETFLAWVVKQFAVIEYVHTDKRAPWCPEWWQHPEVVARLWALWQARLQADEDAAMRLDAVSDWWLTHWDRHTAVLFDSRIGPFRKCDRTLGHLHETDGVATPAVEVVPPPLGWHSPG